MDGIVKRDEMEQHLLFHKALTEDRGAFLRINGYMDILDKAETGEKLNDPVDESIRAVFSLVLESGIDPWEIDLREFVRMYSKKVAENTFDMIVAGKLMLMAWKILRLQSEATRSKIDQPEEEEFFDFDFDLEDEDVHMFVPEVSFKAAFQREEMRPVTMYELLDAFEEARSEIEIQQERERVRAELRAKEPRKFDNKAHEEDDEQDVERVWERVRRFGVGAVLIDELYTGNIMENLKTFVSVLHLVRDGRLNVWQESLPRGDIYIEMIVPGIEAHEGRGIEAVD
ncbi:MAG: chromosome segregation protein ScpA [Candidatus Methanoplasma sp.]|jgi:segregation and condensation protein A|nr:chromosome segregation protein ScpA [Candidatus Methanoplasma sp.]